MSYRSDSLKFGPSSSSTTPQPIDLETGSPRDQYEQLYYKIVKSQNRDTLAKNENHLTFCWLSSLQSRYLLRATPFMLGSVMWTTMLGYFLLYYLTLPRVNGHFPRITHDTYAIWPYISCIGAIKRSTFIAFTILVSTLITTGFILDLISGRNVGPGIYFRISKTILGTMAACFLVAVGFTSIEIHPRKHLILTSLQIWCMGAAKLSDYFMGYQMGRRTLNPHMIFSRRCKKYVGSLASVVGILTLIGVYSCNANLGNTISGTRCYNLTSISAISEWILAITWSLYLLILSYDLYWIEETRTAVIRNSYAPKRPHRYFKFIDTRKKREEREALLFDKLNRLEKSLEVLNLNLSSMQGEVKVFES